MDECNKKSMPTRMRLSACDRRVRALISNVRTGYESKEVAVSRRASCKREVTSAPRNGELSSEHVRVKELDAHAKEKIRCVRTHSVR